MELQQPRRPFLEICVGNLSDALTATTAGADRLELCSATEIGGLTPSAALVERTLELVNVPVIVMIRPRAGGFCYCEEEFKTAVRDAEFAIEQGAAGIAFGFLTADSRIDFVRCRELISIADEHATVFHRAFDFVPDLLVAADQLIELGVTRVLTSGAQSNALAGTHLIRAIAERSAGRLEVMPGGGITADNIGDVLSQTGCDQIHAGASRPVADGSIDSNNDIDFFSRAYLENGRHRAVDSSHVANLVARLHLHGRSF